MTRLDELKTIATRSKKPLPWYGLAMEYRSTGAHALAIETFKHVHTLDPAYVAAYFMCAQLLAEQNDHPAARGELLRGLAAADAGGDHHASGEMRALLDTLDEAS